MGAIITVLEEWYDNNTYFMNAVYYMNQEHWKTVIAAAAWNDDLAAALLKVLNKIDEMVKLGPDDLKNHLLPSMVWGNVQALAS